MTDLDRETRRLLDVARAARTPSAEDRARVRRRLALAGVAVASGVASGVARASAEQATGSVGGGAGGTAAAGSAGVKTWLTTVPGAWMLGGVCVLGAVLGGVAVVATLGARTSAPAGLPTPVLAAPAPVALGSAAPVPGPVAVHEAVHEAVREPDVASERVEADAPEAPARAEAVRRATEPASRERVAGDSLSAELKLLHRARARWQGGRSASALALLERHRASHPRSAVAVEREALRVLCLCDLGRTGQARRVARRWLHSAPESPLRAAVERSCASE